MPAPEIKVRLTADGVQDVVNAFRRVQQESKNTRDEATLTGQAMQQLGELMPIVTIGAAVTKFVELGKGALDSAVSIGKLAQETGASAGTLSVLVMAAHDVGISQDQMGQSLVRLSRNMENASNGSAQSQKAFQSLGISMSDIKSKNPADMFVEIGQKLQAMPDGATKSAIAMQLFGRSGAQLIPVLNEIGASGGFDELRQKAQSLGLYLSDDFIAQAKAGEEELRNMQDVTHGFAMQFMSGFVPEATKAMGDFANTVSSGGTTAFKTLGDFAGNVVRGIVNVFLVGAQTIAVVWTSLFQGLKDIVMTLDKIGNATQASSLSGAWQALKGGVSDALTSQGGIWGAYGSMVKNEYAGPSAAPSLPKSTGGGTGGSGNGTSAAQRDKALKEHQKLIDARATYEDAVGNAEIQKQKLRDQKQEADDKSRYDAGLATLDEYYNARVERINAEADAEEAILQKKLANEENAAAQLMGKSKAYIDNLVQHGPAAMEAAAGTNTQALAMLQKVAATRAQIDEDEIKRQTQLQQNETARQDAQKRSIEQVLTDRERLYQLEGNTSAAQQVALEKEIQETDALLTKLGVAESERQAILDRARVNATARGAVGALSQSGSDAFASLQTDTSAIQDKASAGTISELDAEAQIYNLEKQRLPTLQSIGQAMEDAVDNARLQLLYLTPGTDEYNSQSQVVNNLQKQVDEYTKKVNTLGASLQTTKTFSVELSNQLSTQGTGAAVSFFDAISTGSKSFDSALTDMGKTFETIITHMIDQMLVYYALMAIVGWIAPNSSFYTSLQKSSPFSGLTGHAGGGFTGNGATNQVTGVVHGQEYVMTAAATRKWGLPLLEAMNAGTVNSVASASSYSSLGGVSGGSSGDAGALVELNIDTGGQPASTTQRQGPGGQSIIDVVIGQVASDVAGGGKVGQTIQSTFGLSRKGIVRG